jgi:hypothetical protein
VVETLRCHQWLRENAGAEPHDHPQVLPPHQPGGAVIAVQRLDDPSRHWKISESDYSERELWPKYIEAYEDAISLRSSKHAPWYIIPSNHKWFRHLAVSQIIGDTMDEMGLKLPPTQVDIADIRRKYHAAELEQKGDKKHKK